jgi:hypothetical protein
LQGFSTRNPVAATLFLSIDQIRHNNALAADYLFLCACVDRKDIPLDLLEALSLEEKEDAIKTLSGYALITRRPADSALDLHRLVHRALQEWLQNKEWLDQWNKCAIAQLLRIFPDYDHGNRSKWRRLLPHAKHALSHSLADPKGDNRLLLDRKYTIALCSDGRYNEAEELFLQVTETSSMVLGKENLGTLTSMVNLASTYREQGWWKDAEELECKRWRRRRECLVRSIRTR